MVNNNDVYNQFQLYTLKDVQKILRCSRKTLYNYRDKGFIQYLSINGQIRFKGEHIEDFISQFTVGKLNPSKRVSDVA